MAFDPDVTLYYSGVANSGTSLVIPYSSLEAVSNSGEGSDIRNVMYSLLEGFANQYVGNDPTTGLPNTSGVDRSVNLTCSRVMTIPDEFTIKKTYTIAVTLAMPDLLPSTTGD